MKAAYRLAIVVAVQLLLLLSLIGFKQYTVWTGDTILLKTAPVDPRDLLRGDYTSVRYEISTIPASGVLVDGELGRDVYVELREGGDGYWHAVAIHDSHTRSYDGTVLIKGKVDYYTFRGSTYDLEYGIEQVYVPEGSAQQLPSGADHTVAVKVRVDRFGNAVPLGFVVDGQPFDLRRR